MKAITYLFILSLIIGGCGITSKTTVKNRNTIDDFATTIKKEDLKKHLEVLASDEYEGRETAMPGQKKAAKYIADYFAEIGLEKGVNDTSYFQKFPVDVRDPKRVSLRINGEKLQFLKDFYYFGSFNDTLLTQKDIVYINYGIDSPGYSDYKDIDVRNKVVLVREGIPENQPINEGWKNWRKKVEAAQEHGALAVISIKDNFEENVARVGFFIQNPRMQLHNKGIKDKKKLIPYFYISPKKAQEILSINDSSTPNKIVGKVDIDLNINQVLESDNVLGFLEGTDKKDEIVVITAHYDHLGYDNGEVCNGADDDGSGTVAVLELAQAFMEAKKAGATPRRSILFMTVSGEEKGLLGSEYYTKNPIYPLEKTVVDLNIDMVGRIDDQHKDNNYVYLIGSDKISSDLHEISEKVNAEKTKLVLDYTYNDEDDPNRFYYRSDHYNFAKNGIPVIFYFSGVHEDYHKPTDDVEKIDFEKIQKTARLVFYTAWEVANRDNRLNTKP